MVARLTASSTTSRNQIHAATTTYEVPIPETSWPESLPSLEEEQIISVVCGNTSLNWGVHQGASFQFTPTCCWRTSHINDKEVMDGPSWSVLSRHLPGPALQLVFGTTDDPTLEDATDRSRLRKIPLLSVYVLASNSQQARRVAYCFKDVPARLYLLRPDDFFTKEQGRYETMGVDRVAALKAVTVLHGSPCLVFDGGSAMTWSCSFPNNHHHHNKDKDNHNKDDDNGNKKIGEAHIGGGGIGAGVLTSLVGLLQKTKNAPTMPDNSRALELRAQLAQLVDEGKPLDLFATDTASAIIVQLLTNITMGARHIIRQFLLKAKQQSQEHRTTTSTPMIIDVDKDNTPTTTTTKEAPPAAAAATKPSESDVTVAAAATATASTAATIPNEEKPNDKTTKENNESTSAKSPSKAAAGPEEEEEEEEDLPRIMVTGGDAEILQKLLSWDHNGLFPPDLTCPRYEVQSAKHLVTYAIAFELKDRIERREREPVSELDAFLMGRRVAKEFPKQPDKDGDVVYRGTIMAAVQEDDASDVYYIIQYDDNDSEDLSLVEIYAGLTLFAEVGEKQRKNPAEDAKQASQEKQIASKSASAALAAKRGDVQLLAQQQEEEKKKRTKEQQQQLQQLHQQQAFKGVAKRGRGRPPGKRRQVPTPPTKSPPAAAAATQAATPAQEKEETEKKKTAAAAPVPVPAPVPAPLPAPLPAPAPDPVLAPAPAGEEGKEKRKVPEEVAVPEQPGTQEKAAADASSPLSAPTTKRPRFEEPNKFIKGRVAKFFGREVFFGTIVGYTVDEGEGFWQVVYDDGDEEEFDENDLAVANELYSKQAKRDPKRVEGVSKS